VSVITSAFPNGTQASICIIYLSRHLAFSVSGTLAFLSICHNQHGFGGCLFGNTRFLLSRRGMLGVSAYSLGYSQRYVWLPPLNTRSAC
jgi:hypothetical protein